MKWLKRYHPELFDRIMAYFGSDYNEVENEEISHEFICNPDYDYEPF